MPIQKLIDSSILSVFLLIQQYPGYRGIDPRIWESSMACGQGFGPGGAEIHESVIEDRLCHSFQGYQSY